MLDSPIDTVRTSLQAFQNYVEYIFATNIHITKNVVELGHKIDSSRIIGCVCACARESVCV
jgi:hypothetical protein